MVHGEVDGVSGSARSQWLGVSARVAVALELEIGSGGHEHPVL